MTSTIKVDNVQDTDGNNIINENANTITIGASGDTISIPSGATLANSGTATGFDSINWQSTIVTGATHTASANQGIWIDTTSNACNLTLPGSPSVGDQLIFSDFKRNWGTNAVTLTLNGSKFQGFTSPDPVYDTNGETVHIVYSGSTQGWIPINDGAVADEVPQTVAAEYLVVAGGGSGGTGDGSGAGAGGYLTNYSGTAVQLTPGASYTVTIGGGGSGVSGGPPANRGNSGSNSVLSGTGITTITSIGGGGGASKKPGVSQTGLDGGSGGGSWIGNSAGSGTAPQGFDGEVGQSPNNAGGGGGAGEAGGTDGAGYGGDGASNSITGSAVFYAGGGGATPSLPGGDGGGTAGQTNPGSSSSAPANTGGGSGGSNDQPSGNGGSGVVILRVPTADYPGTTSGSPTVTTSGSDTIIKFTGSGSYTA